jgi:hypothetical protein
MDFVLSKVIMSVCALAVAGILTGVARHTDAPDTSSDLDELLWRFERLVSDISRSGAECSANWILPELPSGAEVEIGVWADRASATSGGLTRWATLEIRLHTWSWNGSVLNQSVVDTLDMASVCVRANSGQSFGLTSEWVATSDGQELMVFIRGPVG